MSDTKIEQLRQPSNFRVFASYSSNMIENMWVALRCEWQKRPKGRGSFLNYMTDTIERASRKYEDFDSITAFIDVNSTSDVTIEKFVGNISEMLWFDINEHARKRGPYNRTLQFIHLFLWCLNPDLVESWGKIDVERRLIPVANIDDSFICCSPKVILPEIINLVEKNLSSVPKDGSPDENKLDLNWKMHGAILIGREICKLSCYIFFINPMAIYFPEIEFLKPESKFDSHSVGKFGRGYALKSKNFVFENDQPIIDRNTFHVIVRLFNSDKSIGNFECLHVEGSDKIFRTFSNGKHLDSNSFKLTIYDDERNKVAVWPSVLDEEKSMIFKSICDKMV